MFSRKVPSALFLQSSICKLAPFCEGFVFNFLRILEPGGEVVVSGLLDDESQDVVVGGSQDVVVSGTQ